ncbi:irregular chiasm C-roughest protein [Daktulosphaira vitifoliae]|uniref:irregular chiasm C-roughest protein n=1 Tax=Daktulosphaira vitifoliae TaxID=58002 RepID=UPI0021A9C770|nr:irregular chiasm C-roughest protein [Daktulosphaira vitifoliae]
MKRLKITLILIITITAFIRGVSSDDPWPEQSFATEPDDRSVAVNGAITLPCRVNNLAGQLQWTKDDFALGTNRKLSYHGYPRYSMTGTDERGEYNLEMNPVTLDDDGVYQCQVGVGKHDEPAIRSKKATITVLVPPDRPRILQGDFLILTEGKPIDLECVSDGGKPPAEITWTDGTGIPLAEGVKSYISTMAADNRRFSTRSVLKMIPRKEYHNTSVWCQAQSTASDNKLRTKIHLHIKYAPKVTMTIGSPGKDLIESSDVQFLCMAKANPPEITYRWFVNDQVVSGETTPELWMTNVTRKYQNSIVRCEAQNVVGKTEDSKVLDILYKPQFRVRPRNVQAEAGNAVTLTCDVDSNPAADIVWTHEKTNKVVGSSSNLTIQVTSITSGRYYCRATAPGFGEIGAEATVLVKGSPVIGTRPVQYGVLGDTVRLECSAYSVPVADRIVWTFQGTVVGKADQKYYTVLEDTLDDGGVRSTLVIRESRNEHFGTYNCTASNVYGFDSVNIALMPRKNFLLSIVVFGAGGGLLVVLVITAIALLWRRSKAASAATDKKISIKNNFNEPDKHCSKESDISSNVSDIKLEMGTAGSSLSSTYQYKIDYGDGTTGSDRPSTPKSGSETGLAPRVGGGIPLAGPVPVDPRYSVVANGHLYSSGVDYVDPIYRTINKHSDRPASSNGYISADRLYDLSPASATPATLIQDNVGLPSLDMNGGRPKSGGDPAALLQYSATYGNPHLKPNGAQWLPSQHLYARLEPPPYSVMLRTGGHQQKQSNVGRSTSVVLSGNSSNYHIGVAKRQTLATHV